MEDQEEVVDVKGLLAEAQRLVRSSSANPNLALAIYAQVVEADRSCVEAYLQRSHVFYQLQDFSKAIKDCTTVLELDAQCLEALARRSQAYTQVEKYSAAARDIETCIRLGRTLAEQNRQLVRKLAARHADVLQEEFDEYYQSLYRLHLREQLSAPTFIDKIRIGESFAVNAIITNEFGLFRDKDIGDFYPIAIDAKFICLVLGSQDRALLDITVDLGKVPVISRGNKETGFTVTLQSSHLSAGTILADISKGYLCYIKFFAKDAASARIVPLLALLPFGTLEVSQPTKPTAGLAEASIRQSTIGNNELTLVGAYRTFGVLGRDVFIRELPDAIGFKIWDCALFLIKYLEMRAKKDATFFQGKNVIELGSGTGLVGLCCWSMGAKSVVLTELAEILSNLDANIHLNQLALEAAHLHGATAVSTEPNSAANITARELAWGTPLLPSIQPPYDMVVASDVIYELVDIKALRQALADVSGPQSQIFLAYRCRGFDAVREKAIFDCLKEVFEVIDAPDLDDPTICFNARILHLRKLPIPH